MTPGMTPVLLLAAATVATAMVCPSEYGWAGGVCPSNCVANPPTSGYSCSACWGSAGCGYTFLINCTHYANMRFKAQTSYSWNDGYFTGNTLPGKDCCCANGAISGGQLANVYTMRMCCETVEEEDDAGLSGGLGTMIILLIVFGSVAFAACVGWSIYKRCQAAKAQQSMQQSITPVQVLTPVQSTPAVEPIATGKQPMMPQQLPYQIPPQPLATIPPAPEQGTGAVIAPIPMVPTADQATSTTKSFCIHCGAKSIEPGAAFCPNCGQRQS